MTEEERHLLKQGDAYLSGAAHAMDCDHLPRMLAALRSALAERDAAQAELAALRQQVAEMREKAEAFDWREKNEGSINMPLKVTNPMPGRENLLGKWNFKNRWYFTLLDAIRAARKEQE